MPSLPDVHVHVLARRFDFWSAADRALRRLADALSRPVTGWEVRECQICPRRPIHIYPRGSEQPVTWAEVSRAIPGCKPPSIASRTGGRRG